jgi:uncharacterized protein (TIGR04255 family)
MLFSNQECVHYEKNQLVEVICQLRFPTVLSIGANEPAEFQETIRDEFPRYTQRQEQIPPQLLPNGVSGVQQTSVTNYHFISADGMWKLNLTNDFIALSTLQYEGWEDFAQRLDKPLASFIDLYRVTLFDRLGLRYVNAISRSDLNLEDQKWNQLISTPFLGLLADESVSEADTSKCTMDTEMRLQDGCMLKLHSGPGMVNKMGQTDSEAKFIFDCDMSMSGNIAGDRIVSSLDTLHHHANKLFRSAVTDTLHNAMTPSV